MARTLNSKNVKKTFEIVVDKFCVKQTVKDRNSLTDL